MNFRQLLTIYKTLQDHSQSGLMRTLYDATFVTYDIITGTGQLLKEDMSSPKCVFHIPELLEVILLHLPALDVPVDQRVSRIWHTVIRRSRLLQEKLCFRATPPLDSQDEFGPHLPSNFEWNPFLSRFCNIGYKAVYLDCITLKAKDYPSASWRQMFVTGLATSSVSVKRGRRYHVLHHHDNLDGIRMGQIVDYKWEESNHGSYVALEAYFWREVDQDLS